MSEIRAEAIETFFRPFELKLRFLAARKHRQDGGARVDTVGSGDII